MKIKILALILCLLLFVAGCGKKGGEPDKNPGDSTPFEDNTALGDDSVTFGDSLEELGVYEGYFDGESENFAINCVSGTKNAYKLEGNTLTFTQISEETVYSVSGNFSGNIVIDVGDAYKFDLELCGFSIVSESQSPITVISGDEVSITAKKDFENYIYDMREAVDSGDETAHSGAVYAETDLEIAGKGSLTLVSQNNNGIHTKDDLQVKNLTLLVACADNALKGNDSVEITGGNLTLIASVGDGIKTSNSDISEKGNQRGDVTVSGGNITIYAACDGIDAAHDVLIE
ncbi:MAG: carbohydrate-binding domain-containing protein, partial [Clostridia bacterium]|nr:carbohydrate-binding domain-containing protein [Clostridia bacterium]